MENAQQLKYRELDRFLSTSPNSSRLVPYAKVGDDWSLPDEFILSIPYQMAEEGSFPKVFYDGAVKSPEEFLEMMQKPANAPVFCFKGDEPLAVAWLNGFSGNVAFAHFCTFRASKGKTEEVGRKVVDYWLSIFPFLHAILGLTPSNNKLAVRFIRRIGFTVLGEIPGVLHDAYEGERVGAVVSYLAR